MARETYCAKNDVILLHSGINQGVNLPPDITYESAIEAAADEMDGYLGFRYVVPIEVSTTDPTKYYGSVLLKTTNSQLAAGRIITSSAATSTGDKVHDYGKYLINSALVTLRSIRDGKINIEFANPSASEVARTQGPIILSGDAFSHVDNFYHNIEPQGFLPGRSPSWSSWPQS